MVWEGVENPSFLLIFLDKNWDFFQNKPFTKFSPNIFKEPLKMQDLKTDSYIQDMGAIAIVKAI